MTKTLSPNGLLLFTLRVKNFSCQERIDTPLIEADACLIASHPQVPMDFRILAVHRLLDIVKTLNGADADRLWGKIGCILRKDFTVDQIPLGILKRFKSVPLPGMQAWTLRHYMRRKARVEAQHLPLAA